MNSKINELIKKKGLMQKEVAEKMGMSPDAFNHKLKRNNFKVKDLQEIADILGYELIIEFKEK